MKRLFLPLAVLVSIVLLGFSTWHQWSANQETVLERMRPIPPMVTYAQGASIEYIAYDPKNPELIAAYSGNILADDSDYIVKVWNLNNQETPMLTLKTHREQNDNTFMVGLGFSPIDNLQHRHSRRLKYGIALRGVKSTHYTQHLKTLQSHQ